MNTRSTASTASSGTSIEKERFPGIESRRLHPRHEDAPVTGMGRTDNGLIEPCWVADQPLRVAAIIVAHNESMTIGRVVETVCQSGYVDEIVVVDNASIDLTAHEARRCGAHVVSEPKLGKSRAIAIGISSTTSDVLLFLDADLLGLTTSHLTQILVPILSGTADMSCGLFDRGPFVNQLCSRYLPLLTGQRAVRREMCVTLDWQRITGYEFEAVINHILVRENRRIWRSVCIGLSHRLKEEKWPFPIGIWQRAVMCFHVFVAYLLIGTGHLAYYVRLPLGSR